MVDTVVSIKSYNGRKKVLVINSDYAEELGLKNKKRCYLSFGTQKCYIDVHITEQIEKNKLFLPDKVIEYLYLPNYVVYEIRVRENEIIIGPYIGILTANNDSKLTEEYLRGMLPYTLNYQNVHGAVVAFALNKIDKSTRLIEGYCYNPKKDFWDRGIFPYPSAIFRRIGLSKQWKNHFLSTIGDTVFNNYYFDKWEMYKWLSENEKIKSHLPETIIYINHQDIIDMLKKYNKIFVKPISGMQGARIAQICLKNDLVIFKYNKGGREGKSEEISFSDSNEMKKFIKSFFKSNEYIIQQPIELLKYKESVIDFRFVMQKNEKNNWTCNAVIGRVGVSGNIVSNICSGGIALTLEKLLRKMFSLSEYEIFMIKEKITLFGLYVCNFLNESGINCADLGLDIGIDDKGDFWLIEINNRCPDPTIALDIKDRVLYYKLKSNPLLYAKFLAGY